MGKHHITESLINNVYMSLDIKIADMQGLQIHMTDFRPDYTEVKLNHGPIKRYRSSINGGHLDFPENEPSGDGWRKTRYT